MERIVLERRDGGSIEEQLSDMTKAAIMRIAVEQEVVAPTAVEETAPLALLASSRCVDSTEAREPAAG
jgi:hypothetical protein